MAFTNTVETVGDAALTRSIIDKSITELNCNITTSIRQQAFRACSALASVNFPNCTIVSDNAFYGCSALAKADFASPVAFADNAFYGCTSLTALILRSTDQLCTFSGTPFASSAIANGNGYIYVHAVMVDQYKASLTAYAAQIRAIEDYPGIADTYSWAGVAANLSDGSYASVYKVHDTVELDMGDEGLIYMEIVGIDVDDLADGSGKAPISWISKEPLDIIRTWNPALVTNDDGSYKEGTGSIGGWEKSEIRTYLYETILPLIPEDVYNMIRLVTKYSNIRGTSNNTINNVATEDSIWIPSKREVGYIGSNYSAETLGVTYTDAFSSANDRKKYIGNEAVSWWLRTSSGNGSVATVGSGGNSDGGSWVDNKTTRIAFGFCT